MKETFILEILLYELSGFPQRLKIGETSNGHGKIMEHERLPNSVEICD